MNKNGCQHKPYAIRVLEGWRQFVLHRGLTPGL